MFFNSSLIVGELKQKLSMRGVETLSTIVKHPASLLLCFLENKQYIDETQQWYQLRVRDVCRLVKRDPKTVHNIMKTI